MNLRFTVFNLLFRDAILRRLLLNYADRVGPGKFWGNTPDTSCFLTLKWTGDDRLSPAGDGSQILTVRAHMPNHRWNEHAYLDSVLRRVQPALNASGRSESVRADLLRTSCVVTKIGSDTIFMASTLNIIPTAAPWRCPAHEVTKQFVD